MHGSSGMGIAIVSCIITCLRCPRLWYAISDGAVMVSSWVLGKEVQVVCRQHSHVCWLVNGSDIVGQVHDLLTSCRTTGHQPSGPHDVTEPLACSSHAWSLPFLPDVLHLLVAIEHLDTGLVAVWTFKPFRRQSGGIQAAVRLPQTIDPMTFRLWIWCGSSSNRRLKVRRQSADPEGIPFWVWLGGRLDL